MRYTLIARPAPEYIEIPGINGATELREKRVHVETAACGQKIYTEGLVELWEDPVNGLPADSGELAPYLAAYREQLTAPLWRAATDWQEKFISGVAIGLLTLGVAQGKPKALAVMKWNEDHWGEYYRRKDIVLSGGAPDYDFTGSGKMPFSVPELQEELRS